MHDHKMQKYFKREDSSQWSCSKQNVQTFQHSSTQTQANTFIQKLNMHFIPNDKINISSCRLFIHLYTHAEISQNSIKYAS